MKHVLSIAGSDPSGGAGIQADLKAFAAWGVHGMAAITALTAQNTCGVPRISCVDPDLVHAQLDAIFEDIRVDAVKIGMLGSAAITRTVADFLATRRPAIVVLDPVLRATSGQDLLAEDAAGVMKECLFPHCDLLTPNLAEAERFAACPVTDEAGASRAAEKLLSMGPRAVLLKGGHLPGEPVDILATKGGLRLFRGKRVDGKHSHGTGCSLASALAALLARGLPLESAVEKAKAWIEEGIRHGIPLGRGRGPIHPFVRLYGGEELTLP